MSKVEEIKQAIDTLPEEEYVQSRHWFSEKDWQKWDLQIAADSELKKLDFLVREALEAKSKNEPPRRRDGGVSRIHYNPPNPLYKRGFKETPQQRLRGIKNIINSRNFKCIEQQSASGGVLRTSPILFKRYQRKISSY